MQSMMMAGGVWPTMITPFTADNRVDYRALKRMIELYIGHGVAGLFAVCQSSEMFFLSLDERIAVAKFVHEQAAGQVQVIASGHVSDSMEGQIAELRAIAATGVQAVVLVSNRLAQADEPEEVWRRNAEEILQAVPDIPFGIYECPYPYKRLLSPELLRWCAETGRFLFLKDTCCDTEQLKRKLEAVRGSGLRIYNANAATLLDSLRAGAHGYSGVMANFHPDLYVRLCNLAHSHPAEAQRLQAFLGVASVIENQFYPVNAKYAMGLEGVQLGLQTRTKDCRGFTSANRLEVEQLLELSNTYRQTYCL
jgi:4-hydroxy-tetrahydrodipicolinate synthase